jgi:hypothetical protein
MVRTPLDIIFEILILLIFSSFNTLLALFKLLGELFASLIFASQASIAGFILAIIIGALFIVFIWKYLFKTTVSLVKLLLVYAGFFVVLIIILFIFFSVFN